MQYAGLPTVHGTSGATHPMQYGHGEVAGQAQQQPQPNASTTSILRNYRKKDSGGNPAEKVQGPEAGSSTGEPQGPVARVAPHAHYPKPNGDGFRYQHFPDFGIQAPQVAPPPVKYSEIIEPPMPTLEHHLPPHAIPKAKDKPSYFDISCSQPHVKGYDFNFGMRPVNNLYKQQYGPPTNAPGPLHHGYYPASEKPPPPHQQPPGYVVNYNKMHQYQARYGQGPRDAGNDFLSNLNKIAPEIAQDILNDPHLRDHQQFPVYLPDQNRLYQQQHARMYQRGTPPGGFNQRNFNYNQYQLNQRENYPRFYQNRFQQFDNSPFPNFNHCAQLNYPPQPYQHFRQQDLLPLHPKNFLESHPEIPEIVPEEAGPPSKSLKSYLENWNEENFLDDTDNPIDASEGGPRSKENTLYVLEAMEIPSESVPQYIHLQPIEKLPPNVQRFYPERDRDATEPNPACKLLQDIATKHRADQPSHPVLHIPDDVPSKSLPILIQDDDEENSNRGNIRWSDCEQENKIRNENPDFSEIGFTSREDSTKKPYFTEMKQDVGSKENDSDLSEINNDKNFDKSNQNRNDTQNNVLKRVATQNIADIKDYVSRENENTNGHVQKDKDIRENVDEETLKNIKGENSDKLKESNFHKSKSIRDFTDIGKNIRGYVSGENTDETLKNRKDNNSDQLKESNFHKSKSINKNFTDIGDGIRGYVTGVNTEEETLKNIKGPVSLKDENSDSNKYDKHNLFQTDFRENVNEDSLKTTKSSDLKSERFDKFKKSKSIRDFTDIEDDVRGYVSEENTDETLKNPKDENSDKRKESNLHGSKSINRNFADIGGYVWGENTDEEILKNTTRSGLKDENSDKFKESDFHKTEMINRNLSDSSKYDEHNLIQTDLRENANEDTLKNTKGSNLKSEGFDYNKSRSINKNTEMINRNSDSNNYDKHNLIQTDFRDDLRENVNEDSLNTTKGSDLKSERFDKFKGSDYNKSKSIKKKFADIENDIRGYVSRENTGEETLNLKGSDLKGENFDKFKESDYNKSKSLNTNITGIGNDIRGYVSRENPDKETLRNIKGSDLKGENFDKFKESDYNKSKSINTNFVDIGDDIRGYISRQNTDEETLKNMNRSGLKDENSVKFKEADFHKAEMINRNLSDSNKYDKHNLITNLRENVNEDPLKTTKGSDLKSERFDKVKESDYNKSKSINKNFTDIGDDIRGYVSRENTDKETLKNVKGSVSLKDENFDKFKESDYNKSKSINKNFTDIGDDIRGYVSRENTDEETLESGKDENFDIGTNIRGYASGENIDEETLKNLEGNDIRGYVSRENTDKETLKNTKGYVSLKDENLDKSKEIKMTNRNLPDCNKYDEHNLIQTDLRENANEDTLKNTKGSDLKSERFDYNKYRSINKNLSDMGSNIRGYVLGQAVDKLKNMKPSSKSINKNQSDIGNDFRGYDSRENLNEVTNSYKSNDFVGYDQWETEDEKTLNRSKSINQNLSVGRNDVIRHISKEEVKESNSYKLINQNLKLFEDPPQTLENQVFSETTKANQNRGKPQSPKVAKKLFKQFRITDPIRKYQMMSSSKTDDNQNNSTDDLDVSPIDLSTKFEAEAAESSSDSEVETTDYETECTSSSSSEDTGSRGDQEDDVYESCLLSTENRLLIRKTVSSAKKTALNKETKQKTKNDIVDKSGNITNETRKPHLSSMENLEAFDKVSRRNTKKRDKESTHLKESIWNKRFKNDSRIKMRINRSSEKESECYDSELEILQLASEGDSKRKHIEDEIFKDREEEEDVKTKCYLSLGNVQKSSKRFNLKSSKRKLISDFGENSEESFLKYTKSKVTMQEAKPDLFQNEAQTLSEEEFSTNNLETVTKEMETKEILPMETIQKIPDSNIRKNNDESICSFEEEKTKTKGDLSKGTVQKDSEIFNIKSSKFFKDEKEEETQFGSGFNSKTPKRKLVLNSDFEENCEGSSDNLQSSKSEITIDENHLLKTKENLFQITSNSSIEKNDEVETKGYCLMGTIQKDSERYNLKSSKRMLILDSKDAMVIEEMNEFCRGELTTPEEIVNTKTKHFITSKNNFEISDDESSKVNLSKNEEGSNRSLENSKGFNLQSSKRKLSSEGNFEEDCEESSHNNLKYTKTKVTIRKTNLNQEEDVNDILPINLETSQRGKEKEVKTNEYLEPNLSLESSENKSVMLKININESSKSKTILETDYNLFEDEIETKESLIKGDIQITSKGSIGNKEESNHNLESSKSTIPNLNLFKDEIKTKENVQITSKSSIENNEESISSIQSSKSKTIGETNPELFEQEIKTKQSVIKGNVQITSKSSIGNNEESIHSIQSSKSKTRPEMDYNLFKEELKTEESLMKGYVQITCETNIRTNPEESICSNEPNLNLFKDEIKTKESLIKKNVQITSESSIGNNEESNHSLESSKSTIQEDNLNLVEDEIKTKKSLIKKNVQITSKSSIGNNKELESSKNTIQEANLNLFEDEIQTKQSLVKGNIQITSKGSIGNNKESNHSLESSKSKTHDTDFNLFEDEIQTKQSLIKGNIQITSKSSMGNNKESNHSLESSKGTIQEANLNLFEDEIKTKSLIKKNIQITSKSSIGNNKELESSKNMTQEINLNLFEDQIQTKQSLIKENIEITSKSSIGNNKESNHSLEPSKSTIRETNLNLFEHEIKTKENLIKENIQITSKSSIGSNKESNCSLEPSKSTIQETNLNIFEDEIKTKQSLLKENIQITTKRSIGSNKELETSKNTTQETNLNLFQDEIKTKESLIKGNVQITSKSLIGNNEESNCNLEVSKHKTIEETNRKLSKDEVKTKESLIKGNVHITSKSSIGNSEESSHIVGSFEENKTRETTNLKLIEEVDFPRINEEKEEVKTKGYPSIGNIQKYSEGFKPFKRKLISDIEETNLSKAEIKPKEQLSHSFKSIKSMSTIEETNIEDEQNEEAKHNLETSKSNKTQKANLNLFKDEIKTKELQVTSTEGNNEESSCKADTNKFSESKLTIEVDKLETKANLSKNKLTSRKNKRDIKTKENLLTGSVQMFSEGYVEEKEKKSVCTFEDVNTINNNNKLKPEENKPEIKTKQNLQMGNVQITTDSNIQKSEQEDEIELMEDEVISGDKSIRNFNQKTEQDSEKNLQTLEKTDIEENEFNKFDSQESEKQTNQRSAIETREHLLGTVQKIDSLANIPKTKDNLIGEEDKMKTTKDLIENVQKTYKTVVTENVDKLEESVIETNHNLTGNVAKIQTQEGVTMGNETELVANLGFAKVKWNDVETNEGLMENVQKIDEEKIQTKQNTLDLMQNVPKTQTGESLKSENIQQIGFTKKLEKSGIEAKDNLQKTFEKEHDLQCYKEGNNIKIKDHYKNKIGLTKKLEESEIETKDHLVGNIQKIQINESLRLEKIQHIGLLTNKIETKDNLFENIQKTFQKELACNLEFSKDNLKTKDCYVGNVQKIQKDENEMETKHNMATSSGNLQFSEEADNLKTKDCLMENVQKIQTNESLTSEDIQQMEFTNESEESEIKPKDNLISNVQKIQTNENPKSQNIRQIRLTNKLEESEIETKDNLMGNVQKMQTNESFKLENIQQVGFTSKLEESEIEIKDRHMENIQQIRFTNKSEESEIEPKDHLIENVQKSFKNDDLQCYKGNDVKTKDHLMGNVQKIQTNENLRNFQQLGLDTKLEESEVEVKEMESASNLKFSKGNLKTKDCCVGNVQKIHEQETQTDENLTLRNIQQTEFTDKQKENGIETKHNIRETSSHNLQFSKEGDNLKTKDCLMGNIQKIQTNESLASKNIRQIRFTNKLEESKIEIKDNLIENVQKTFKNELTTQDLQCYKEDDVKTKDRYMRNVQKIQTNEGLNTKNIRQIRFTNELEEIEIETQDDLVGNRQKIQTNEGLNSKNIQQMGFISKLAKSGIETTDNLVRNVQNIQTNEGFESENIQQIRLTNKLGKSGIETQDNLMENVQKIQTNEGLKSENIQQIRFTNKLAKSGIETTDNLMENVQKIQTNEGLKSESIRQIGFTNELEESGIETKDNLVGNVQKIQTNEGLNSENIQQMGFISKLEESEIETKDNLVENVQKIQTNEGLNSENIKQVRFTNTLEENKIETKDNHVGNDQKIQTNEGLESENIQQIRFTNKLEENRIETNDNLMRNIQEIQVNKGFNSKNIRQIRFTNELEEIEIETQDNLVGNIQKIQTNESLKAENIRQIRFSNKLDENKIETQDNLEGNVQEIQTNEGLTRQIRFSNKLAKSGIETKDNLMGNVQKIQTNESLESENIRQIRFSNKLDENKIETQDNLIGNVQKIQTNEGLNSKNIRQSRSTSKLKESAIETKDNLIGNVQKIETNESLKSENIRQTRFTNKLEEREIETKDNLMGNSQEVQTSEGLNSKNIRQIRFSNKLEEIEIETQDNLMGNVQKIQTNEGLNSENIRQISFTNELKESEIETKDNLIGDVKKIQTNESFKSENIRQTRFTNKLEEREIETKDNLIGNIQKIQTSLKSENTQQIRFANKLVKSGIETKDNLIGNIQKIQTNEDLNSKNIRQIRFSNKLEESEIETKDNLMGNIQEIQTNEGLNSKNIRQIRFTNELEEIEIETQENLMGNVQKILTNEGLKSENIEQIGFTNKLEEIEIETKDNLMGNVQKIQTNESLKFENIRQIRFPNELEEIEIETQDNLVGNIQKIKTNEGLKSENIRQSRFANKLEKSEIETKDNFMGNIEEIQTNEGFNSKNIRQIRFTNKLEESAIETRDNLIGNVQKIQTEDNLIGNVQKIQTNESLKSKNIRQIRFTNKLEENEIETQDNLMMGNVQKIQTNETLKSENIPQIGFTNKLEESRIETEDYLMENIQKELASNVEFSKTDDGNLKTKDCCVGNIQKTQTNENLTPESIQQAEFITTKTKDRLMGNVQKINFTNKLEESGIETKDNLIKNIQKTFQKQLSSNLEFPKEDDLKTKDSPMGNVQRFHTNESCTLENAQQIRSTNKLEESEIKTKDNLIEYVQKIHKEKIKTNENLTIGNLQNIIKNMFGNKLKGSGVETRNIRDTDETKTNVQKTSECELIESEGSSKVEHTKSEDADHTREKIKNKELEDEEEVVNETVDDETVENVILEIFREYIRIDVTESDRGKKVISITPLTDVVVVVNEKTCETENEELGESRVNLEELHECGGVEDLEKETATEELGFDGKEEETKATVSKKSIEENSSVEVCEVIDLDEVDQQISMEEKKIQVETGNQTSCPLDTDRSWTHLDKVIKEISAVKRPEVPMKNCRQKIQKNPFGGIQKHSILKKSKLDNVKKAQSFEGFIQNSFRSKKQNRVRFNEVCQNNKELNTEKNFESNQVPSDANNTEGSKETKKSSKTQSSGRVGKIKGILMETRGLQTRLQNQLVKTDKTKETERFDKKTEGSLKEKRRRKYKQIVTGLLDFEVPTEESEDVKEILDLTQSGQVRVTLRKQSLKKLKETASKECEGVKEIQSLTQLGKVSKDITLGNSRHIRGNLRKQDSSNLKEIQLDEPEDIQETAFVSKIQNLTPSGKTTEDISLGKSRQIRGNLRKQDSSDLKEIPFEEPKDIQETALVSKIQNPTQSGRITEEIFSEKSRQGRGNIRRERSSINLKEALLEELEHVKEIQNLTPPGKMIEETSLGKSRQIRGHIRKERSSINREELEDVKEIQSLTQPGKVSEKIALGEPRQIRDNLRRQISINLREIALEKLEQIQNLTSSGKIMEEIPLEKFRQVRGNLRKDQSFINLKVSQSEDLEVIQEKESVIQSGKIGENSLRKSRQIRGNPRRQSSSNLNEIPLEEPEDIQEIQNLTPSRKINEEIPLEKVQSNIRKERSLTNLKETLDFPKEEISLGQSKQIRGNLKKQSLNNLKEIPLEELENIQDKQNVSPSEKNMEQIPLAVQETERLIQSEKIIGGNLGKSKQIRGNLKKQSSNPREILLEQPEEIQEIQKLTPSGKIVEEISLGKSRQIRDNIRKERRTSFEECETVETLKLNEEIALRKFRQIRDNLRKQSSTNSKETPSEEHEDIQEMQNPTPSGRIIEEISLGKSRQIRDNVRKERGLSNLKETSFEEFETVERLKLNEEIALGKTRQIRDNLRKQSSTTSKETPSEEHDGTLEIQNLSPSGKIIEENSLGKSKQIRGTVRKERSLTNLGETSLEESEDVKEILNLTQPGKMTGEISLVKSKQIRGNLRKQSSTNSKETPSEEHEDTQEIQNLTPSGKIIEEISLGKSRQIRDNLRKESSTNSKETPSEEHKDIQGIQNLPQPPKIIEEISFGKSKEIRGTIRKERSLTNVGETSLEESEDVKEILNLTQPEKITGEISIVKSKQIRGSLRKQSSTNFKETPSEEHEDIQEKQNPTPSGRIIEEISLGKSKQIRGNLRKQNSTNSKETLSEGHKYIQEIQNLSQPSKTIEEISFGKSKDIRGTIRKERSLTNLRETSLEESEDVKEILNLTQPGKITGEISLEKSKQIRGNLKKQNSTNSKVSPSEEHEDTQEMQNLTPSGKIIEEVFLGKSGKIRVNLRKEKNSSSSKVILTEESEVVQETENLIKPGKIIDENFLGKSKQIRGNIRKERSLTNLKATSVEESEAVEISKLNEEIPLGKSRQIRGNLRKQNSKETSSQEQEDIQNPTPFGKVIEEISLGKPRQVRGCIRKERSSTNLKEIPSEEFENVKEVSLPKSKQIQDNTRREEAALEEPEIQNLNQPRKSIGGKCKQVRGGIRKERISTSLKEIPPEILEDIKEMLNLTQPGKVNEPLGKSRQIQDNIRKEQSSVSLKLSPSEKTSEMENPTISGTSRQIRGNLRRRSSTNLREFLSEEPEDIKAIQNATPPGKIIGESFIGKSRQIRGNLRRQSSTSIREFPSEEPEDKKTVQNAIPAKKIIGENSLGNSRQIRGNLRRQSSTSIREISSEEHEVIKETKDQRFRQFRGNIKTEGSSTNLKGIPMKDTKDVFLRKTRQVRGNIRKEQSSINLEEFPSEGPENITGIEKPKIVGETSLGKSRQIRGNTRRELSLINLKRIPLDEAEDKQELSSGKFRQIRGNISKEQSSTNIVGEISSEQIRDNVRKELSLTNLIRILPIEERFERPSEDLDINENLITGHESDVEDENPPELTAEDGRAEPASLDTMPDLEPMVPRIKKRRKEDVEESKQYLDPSKRLYANDHLQEKKRRLSLEEYNIRKRRYLPSKTRPKENLFSGELVTGLDFESAKLQEEIEEEVLRNLTSPSRDEPESVVRTVEEPKESPRVLPRQIRFHDFSSFDDSDFEEETRVSVSCDLRVTFVDKSIVEEKLDSLVDFLPRVTSSRRNTSEEISQKIDDLFAERPIYEQRNYDRVLLDRFLRNESLSSDELTKLRDVVLGRKVTLHGVRRREDLKTVNIDFNDFNLRVVEDEPKPQTSKTKAELKMFVEDPEEEDEEEWFRNPEKPSEIETPIEIPHSLPPKEDDNQQTALIKKPSEPTKLAKMNAIIQLYKKALETPNIGDKIKEIEEIIDKVTQGNLDQIKKAITSSTSKPTPSQPPTPNVYEITANDHPNDMKLHLKKVQGKRAKRKRFRNLYAEDSEEDEPTGEKHQRYDGYSIVSGDPKRLPKLVIKLKKAGPHPYVKLSRLPLLENMVRRRKRTVLLTGLAAQN